MQQADLAGDPHQKKSMSSCASRFVSCLNCPCWFLTCGHFSCQLCIVLMSIVSLVVGIVVILYFCFRPHMIAATVDWASIVKYDLGPFEPARNSSLLTYNLSVHITVRNPNKRVGLYYDDVESLALFEDQRFGDVELQPFYQGTKGSTEVSLQFNGTEPLQGNVTAVNFKSQQREGKFAVDVKLHANLRVKVWAWKFGFPGSKANITCPLSIPAPNQNGIVFQPTDCIVF